jgi:hypothetical protein
MSGSGGVPAERSCSASTRPVKCSRWRRRPSTRLAPRSSPRIRCQHPAPPRFKRRPVHRSCCGDLHRSSVRGWACKGRHFSHPCDPNRPARSKAKSAAKLLLGDAGTRTGCHPRGWRTRCVGRRAGGRWGLCPREKGTPSLLDGAATPKSWAALADRPDPRWGDLPEGTRWRPSPRTIGGYSIPDDAYGNGFDGANVRVTGYSSSTVTKS